MRIPLTQASALGALGALILVVAGRSAVAVQDDSVTPRAVDAAKALLSSLDDSQRQRVLYAFDDNAQRARWSNFPTGSCRGEASTSRK